MKFTIEEILKQMVDHYAQALIDKIKNGEANSCQTLLEQYKQHLEVYYLFRKHKWNNQERKANDLSRRIRVLLHPLKSVLLYFVKHNQYPPNTLKLAFDMPTAASMLVTLKSI